MRLPAFISSVIVKPQVDSAGQSRPSRFVLFYFEKKSDSISPFGPIKLQQLSLLHLFFFFLTSVVLHTSYFQTRKQTAREEQDVLHAPGVSSSRVKKKEKRVGG